MKNRLVRCDNLPFDIRVRIMNVADINKSTPRADRFVLVKISFIGLVIVSLQHHDHIQLLLWSRGQIERRASLDIFSCDIVL